MSSFNQALNNESVPYVKQHPQTSQYSLHASRPYQKEEVIVSFYAGLHLSAPTYLTIQTGDDCHIALEPSFLQYVNHSCAPNAFFDTLQMKFVALTAIGEDDELTFFYPSTEWYMAQAFTCHCNGAACLGTIQGAAFLSKDILASYRLSHYIMAKLKQ